MNRTKIALVVLIALNSALPLALAHGPQMQVTTSAGKLVTHGVVLEEHPVNGYGPITDPKRVYVIPLLESLGDDQWFARPNSSPSYYSGPGFAYGFAGLEVGSQITLKFLDGLQGWTGSSYADPGSEQLQAFRGSFAAPSAKIVTVDAGPSAALTVVPSFAAGATPHATTRFRLLGDGSSPTASSDDGIYLATMQLSSNSKSPVVADSDPYYFLLHKNALAADVDAALASLLSAEGISSSLVQVVPEPGSLGLLALGLSLLGLGTLRRSWRRG